VDRRRYRVGVVRCLRLGACLAALAGIGTALPAAAAPLPAFKHVVVVVFENHEANAILGSRDAPTFNALAKRYAVIGDYRAITHPSLPNYLALVSGSTQGITNDCTDCTAPGRSLADTLGAAGKTWKTYAEGIPSPGFTGATAGRYAKKHDPFLYFPSVTASRAQRADVVGLPELAAAVQANRLPAFSLVVPDLCNDMHDCSVRTGDRWLKRHVVPLLTSPALAGGVVFVVFDEGSSDTGGGGKVAALALGPLVARGSRSTAPTSHYGLLRTIEGGLDLPFLGSSRGVKPIVGIWR
jgi:phosphatidylinositol-3-phosphatase